MKSFLSANVLVLNGNYEPLNIVTAKRAIVLIYQKKAEMIFSYNGVVVRSAYSEYRVPSVIRLVKYIKIPRKEIPLTKRNILKRDDYTCQYCGSRDYNQLTVDHVIPKVLGGKDTWENMVTACVSCNNKKGDKTPEMAGMKLLTVPKKPIPFLFRFQLRRLPDPRWKAFLFDH